MHAVPVIIFVCQIPMHIGTMGCPDRLTFYLVRACVSNTLAMRMPCW
jgi:hypothetical protein